MRHLRICLLLAVLGFVLAAPASAPAAPTATRPAQTLPSCTELASRLHDAQAQRRHLRKQLSRATGAKAKARLRRKIRRANRRISRLKRQLEGCPEMLAASCTQTGAGPGETHGTCHASHRRRSTRSALRDASSPVTAMKVVLPGGRQVTNYICPTQLPQPSLATTNTNNDTLVCSGGSMAIGTDAAPTEFTFNIRMTPPPTTGMGAQLFLEQDGAFQGPFPITGP